MIIQKFNLKNKSLILFSIFILINLSMHFLSIENASFVHGADAGRYYLSAIEIASGNGFGDLSYNGPLYPIFLSIHIYLFGEINAISASVITQCILLFFTGYLISLLAKNLGFSVFPLTVLIFVIINPNSIMIAHLIQTETLFTFLLTAYFFYLQKYFESQELQILILLALLAVLISLTRPAGMYVMILFSLISIPLLFKFNIFTKWIKHNFIYLIILSIGINFLGIYNLKTHGEYFITSNKGHVFHDQYVALLQFGKNLPADKALIKAKNLLKTELKPELSECKSNMALLKCKDEVASIYIKEISNEDRGAIIKGLSSSFASFLFTGGASNFINYFGLEAKNHIVSFERSSGGIFQIKKIFSFLSTVNIYYLLALFVFWGWAILTKFLLIIGFVHEIKKGHKIYLFSLSLIVFLFIAEYLFLGQSRWRAPLDPIFMMFSAVGFIYLFNKLKGLNYQS